MLDKSLVCIVLCSSVLLSAFRSFTSYHRNVIVCLYPSIADQLQYVFNRLHLTQLALN